MNAEDLNPSPRNRSAKAPSSFASDAIQGTIRASAAAAHPSKRSGFPVPHLLVHLDEIEAIYTRKAGNVVPIDAFNYLGMIAGVAQRILDRTALETEVAGYAGSGA
jgi:hypothetical protein